MPANFSELTEDIQKQIWTTAFIKAQKETIDETNLSVL